MKKILLLFAILIIGCGKDDNTTPPRVDAVEEPVVVDPNWDNDAIYSKTNPKQLNSYWTAFKASAALYGHDLSHITDVEFISESIGGGTAGIAVGSCEDNVRVRVDESIFIHLSLAERIFLMYHELGHDVFNASHAGGGLMAPQIRNLDDNYNLFQTEVSDFFTGVDYIEWTDEECEIIRGFDN